MASAWIRFTRSNPQPRPLPRADHFAYMIKGLPDFGAVSGRLPVRKPAMFPFKPFRFLLAAVLGAMSLVAPAAASDEAPALLMVVIEEIRSQNGRVHVGVWSDPDGFGKENTRVAGTSAPVDGPSQTLVIEGLKPGTYALAAYHDENDNGDFDRTWIGLPDEGLGFSNGAWITIFGAPSFDTAAVELRRPSTRAVIALRY